MAENSSSSVAARDGQRSSQHSHVALVSQRRIAYGAVSVGQQAFDLVRESLQSTRVSTGPHIPRFEELFAGVVGAQHAVATSSGTDACAVLMASLLDRGAQRGDEVIVPALTFCATANAVLMAGLTPKFVDIDRATLNINPASVEAAITPRTRALFPVHLMGRPAPLDELYAIARRHDLLLFEDACQAHGASYRGRRIGSYGIGIAFSLYAAHLICTGEGGVITTDSDEMADLYRSLRSHGRPPGELTFDFQRVGFNSKLDELSAALGIDQLARYEELRRRRKYNYDFLARELSCLPHVPEWLWVPREESYEVIGPQAFPFVVHDGAPFTRVELERALTEAGIEWKTLFGSLPTQHRAYRFLGYQQGDFPESEYVGRGGLHVGVHQDLTDSDLVYIIDTFRHFLAGY